MKKTLYILLILALTAGISSLSIADDGKKWEYRCIQLEITDIRNFQDHANELGEQGWEMVGGAGAANNFHTTQLWCFKREKKVKEG